jgi:hypothetical protein
MRLRHQTPRDRVGRYAIQGEIATGGMATVHYGRLIGPGGFTRGVAIKRLHPQFAKDPHFVAMFLDEARLASRIRHPNVVPILDVVAEEGELFLVMEFIPGEAISKLFRKTPEGLPASIASSIGVGMLEGLHAAHEARGDDGEPLAIVHRDVSPQNVLIGSDGVARLIDFGVAKAVGNASATRDGQIKGKVAYMAPEQIRAEAVDRRADLYAASVVLWELVTGKRYFDESGTDAAVVLRTLTKEPVAPSTVRAEVSPELDQVILKGLSRDPAGRYATAREMAQALEKVAPPAAARDVARWVDAKAGDALRIQARRFSSFDLSVATELPGRAALTPAREKMEEEPAAQREAVTSPTVEAPMPLAGEEKAAAPPETEDERAAPVALPPPLSTPSPEPAPPAWERSRRSMAPLVVAGIFAAGVIGFVLARMLPSTPPPAAAQQAPVEASVPTPVADDGAPTSSSSPVAESAEPIASVSSPIPASASAKRNPQVGAPPTAKPPATTKPNASPNCTPPYRITADGVREYKPECLR